MTHKNLIPVLNDQQSYMQVTFTFDVKVTEDKALWDYHDDLAQFIEDVHNRYYQRYTTQEFISKVIRIVDADKLARDLLSQIENANSDPCRINLQFTISKHDVQLYFVKEYIQYFIHWYETPEIDKIDIYFPVGFQTLHNFTLNEKGMNSSVIFDLRVLNKEIEDSLDFFKEHSFNQLDSYLKYLVDVYENISGGQKVTLDMGIVRDKLDELVTTLYEQRLANPSSNERQIIFLEAFYSGDKPENARVSFHILATVSETKTPHLFVGHPEYQERIIKERMILQSYGSKALEDHVNTEAAVDAD